MEKTSPATFDSIEPALLKDMKLRIQQVLELPQEQLEKFEEIRVNLDWKPDLSVTFIPKS